MYTRCLSPRLWVWMLPASALRIASRSLLWSHSLALLPLILALTLTVVQHCPEGCWHFQGARVKTEIQPL